MIKFRIKIKARDLNLTLVTFWILLAVKCPLENYSKPYGRATAMPTAWEFILLFFQILSKFCNRLHKKSSNQNDEIKLNKLLNSHAVGMAVARPLGFEIDFVRNPISGSPA